MLTTLIHDLRYGLRTLLARPGFALAAMLTLALGIGANTAVCSVIDALLLKPLPYPDSAQLVDINNTYPRNDLPLAGDSIPDYLDRRAQAPALEDSALYHAQSYNLSVDGAPQRLNGVLATPSLFSTLKVEAALGRSLHDADATAGNDHVAVIGYGMWQSLFAGDRGVIGRDVVLNGASYRIVGVMPKGFFFPDRNAQLWTPFTFTEEQKSDKQRGWEFSNMLGRLKPGASIAQLDAQMDAIVKHNMERLAVSPEGAGWKQFVESSGFTGVARSLRDAWVGDLRPTLWLLQALVACVLLIACANVANLMLTRLSARQKELSVRVALGAGQGRIARQLLVESVLLALCGGVFGIALAYGGVSAIRALGLGGASASFELAIDAPVLAFSLALSVATGLLFGLFPLLTLRGAQPFATLKEGGRGNSSGPAARRVRNGLVVLQTAMAVALLGVAGLLIRSFIHVQQQSPGFDSGNVLSATIDLPKTRYPDHAARAQFYQRVLDAARALPGVESAGLASSMPFTGNNGMSSYAIEGRDAHAGPMPHGYVQSVDEDFFRTLKIPLLQGRGFSSADAGSAPRVAVIDELLARKYFPNESAIGKRISTDYSSTDPGKTKWMTVVGVVGTIKRERLSEQTIKETIYSYYQQDSDSTVTLALRSKLDPAALAAPLREALLRVDAEQPVFDVKTMDERIALSLDDRRTPMLLLILFAVVALALCAVGIYGVLAFAVALRTSEIGVRLSLGASRSDILKLVLRDGGRLTALGLGLGLVGAVGFALALRTQLYGVGVVDPLTLGAVLALIVATAFLACWLPARRAARVSPIVALRYE